MLNRYKVVEPIVSPPYKGQRWWKIFARSESEAMYLASRHRLYQGQQLQCSVLQKDIKGTKQSIIIRCQEQISM